MIWDEADGSAEEKYEKCLGLYRYLQEDEYAHKREQLYLMVHQGMSGKFVKTFFKDDSNISSTDLDMMRCMALLMGEDFVLNNFYRKEFTPAEAKQIFGERMAEEAAGKLPELRELIREREHLQETFDLQMKFLKKEREETGKHYQELLEQERENRRLEQELLRARMEQENAALASEKEQVQSENTRLNESLQQIQEERRQLLQMCSELKRQLKESRCGQDNMPPERRYGILQQWLRANQCRREKKQKNDFVKQVISNPAFSKEQLEVILRMVQEGMPLERLEQICVPELAAENMSLLAEYFRRYGDDEEYMNKGTEEKSNG